MKSVNGVFDKVLIRGLIALGAGVTAFLGYEYLRITSDAIGTPCAEISQADADSLELEFVTRRRSEQRLHVDYDLQQQIGAPAPDCATVLGESRCSVIGPTYLKGSLRSGQVIYQVLEGQSVIVRAYDSDMFCVVSGA